MTDVKVPKPKTNSVKQKLTGVTVHKTVKAALDHVASTMGELHAQSVDKAKRGLK